MSKKDSKIEAPKNNDFYQPILEDLSWTKLSINNFKYYELRMWKNHFIILSIQFNTLKEAKNYYKKNNFEELEEKNQCYIEIIKIKNLNPKYIK